MLFRKKRKGFSLIEVMVAMTIIAAGFLGIYGLNSSFRLVIEAHNRFAASLLAENLATRMKVNFVEARKGGTSIYNDPGKSNGSNQNCAPPGSTVCTPIQMAQFDLYQIYAMAPTSVPNGVIKVCLDSSANGSCNNSLANGLAVYSVIVTWSGQNGKTQTFLSSVLP